METKTAGADDDGKRLDAVARKAFSALSLGLIFKALRTGRLRLNDRRARPDTRVKAGDLLTFYGAYSEEVSPLEKPENPSGLNVLFESDDWLILNKPCDMLTHDGSDSLEAAVSRYLPAGQSLSFKPGPVHRLDRNTSGAVAFAKTASSARAFAGRQQDGAIVKIYLGIVMGKLDAPFTWRDSLARTGLKSEIVNDSSGQIAITHGIPVSCNDTASLVLFALETGRTHQIRVQSSAHGRPLRGDVKYGGGGDGGYRLHAALLKDASSDGLFPPIRADLPGAFYEAMASTRLAYPREAVTEKMDILEKLLLER